MAGGATSFADTIEARIARHDLKDLHKEDLPTPCMLVDQEIFDANLQRMANHCRTTGIHLRGHVKVHKSTEIARRQIALGSIGVTCATVAECELMSSAGIKNILLTRQRVLGLYVREQNALSLMDAIRKMTLMPAQRLQASVPAMRNKGRIKIGADADIVVFNPDKVIDKATFENAAQYSEGIEQVMVAGVFVLRNGNFVNGVYPGMGLRTK